GEGLSESSEKGVAIEEDPELTQCGNEHLGLDRVEPANPFLKFVAEILQYLWIHRSSSESDLDRPYPPNLLFQFAKGSSDRTYCLPSRVHVVFKLNSCLAATADHCIPEAHLLQGNGIMEAAFR